MPSFGERDDSPPGVCWKTWRVHRVHRVGKWSFQEEPKQGEWTEASFEEKTPSYESWRASSAHSLVFWRKSYVPRGVNGAMFAVNKSLKGFKGLCHEGENRLSKSRFWLPWLGFGCDLWRLSTPLLMVSPERKTNQSIVKCVSGLTQSDYKWLWSRC